MICAPAEARPAFRLGVRERNGRECSEDGADDHSSEGKLGVCAGNGEAQSPRGEAASISATY